MKHAKNPGKDIMSLMEKTIDEHAEKTKYCTFLHGECKYMHRTFEAESQLKAAWKQWLKVCKETDVDKCEIEIKKMGDVLRPKK